MLICGANDVIGVGQYGYTAVYTGAGVLQAVFGYCSGAGTGGTGLQVLRVCKSSSSCCCRCTWLYY